ncbi:hypothetical protein [Spirosoma litoris]
MKSFLLTLLITGLIFACTNPIDLGIKVPRGAARSVNDDVQGLWHFSDYQQTESGYNRSYFESELGCSLEGAWLFIDSGSSYFAIYNYDSYVSGVPCIQDNTLAAQAGNIISGRRWLQFLTNPQHSGESLPQVNNVTYISSPPYAGNTLTFTRYEASTSTTETLTALIVLNSTKDVLTIYAFQHVWTFYRDNDNPNKPSIPRPQ